MNPRMNPQMVPVDIPAYGPTNRPTDGSWNRADGHADGPMHELTRAWFPSIDPANGSATRGGSRISGQVSRFQDV